jgi:hypothetical protein
MYDHIQLVVIQPGIVILLLHIHHLSDTKTLVRNIAHVHKGKN